MADQFRATGPQLEALASVCLTEMESLTRTLLQAVTERDLSFDHRAPTRRDADCVQQGNMLLRHIIAQIAAKH